jgi:hypothetical protein
MTPCDNRQLDSSKGHFAIGVSILLLALAVFGWGLHSKLSLYHVRAGASEAVPIAKLLSERERPSDTAEHSDLSPGDLHAVALVSVGVMPLPAKQIVVAAPRRESLPLPSRTLALKGPSLRRPPPSHLA